MLISISDTSLLPDLLAYLRGLRFIAFAEGDRISAVVPELFNEREQEAVATAVEEWARAHRGLEFKISDD